MDSEKKKEQQRVDYVIGRIKEKIETTENELEKARKETSSVEKNYVQNAKINTFEVDDRMETNAEVQQQKQLVAKNVENERILKQELSKLTLLKDSPYFGRIDILDQGEDEPESLYIGTASFAENSLLGRMWRDINTGTRHASITAPMGYELHGNGMTGTPYISNKL